MSPFRFEVDIKTIGILGNRPFLVITEVWCVYRWFEIWPSLQDTALISTHSNKTHKASAATPTRRWLFLCYGPCTKWICDSCTAQNRSFDKVINNRLSISGTIFGANNPSFKDALDKDRCHDIQCCWRLLVWRSSRHISWWSFWPPSSPVPLSLFPCFSSMSDKKISRSLSSKIK